jgi:solute carrier family 25 protein 38
MLQVGRAIARTEGVRALWAGVGPACLRVGGGAGAARRSRATRAPASPLIRVLGLYFLCLSNAQKALATRWPRDADGEPALPALRTFALGAFSRATAAVVFCPVTVVKTRMEYAAVSGVRYRGTLHALATIARAERVRGLFSGLAPTLLRDAPYSGLYLVMFTHMRHAMGADAEHPGLSFLASVLAGGVATVVTHPPDVVRTRAQLLHTMGGGAAAARAAAPAAGMRAIARTEGLAALWSGVTPRIARRTLQQGITWTLFEFLFGARLV